MLYPKNASNELSLSLFQNPTAEYRATPFWAWNCKLRQETLDRQIDCMQRMGFGGFHMHVRVGMETKYLSDPFMDLIRGCVEKARGNEMLAWLYDEDKWPSGFAGGYVTKDVQHREKFLLFTPNPYGAGEKGSLDDSSARAVRAENGKLLARFAVCLNEDGSLQEYKRLSQGETAPGDIWYAYLETQGESTWYNLETYVDTLSPAAIEKFVEITHERYLECVGDEFGKLVPAIFTDEPQFAHKGTLPNAFSKQDITLPYTTDFDDTYFAAYGEHILDKLPELYWELPHGVSTARYRYHDHVAERFAAAFSDTIGNWCEQHDLMLTGHMMEEPTLKSQTAALGDCMRSYRSFQLPGIDILCDNREFTTAKQAQSAAHQYGRPGVLSELYGVTNWNFDFRKHKTHGDWQAALGISVRVPHLYWVSMRGEAKRDYPASIGHQSPWYEEYKYLEDHFARVHTAMTRGKPVVKIGVIHPVESYWLRWGPTQQTIAQREDMDGRFQDLADWLLYGTLDFDYICESLLPKQFQKGAPGFTVGEMQYDVILVPGCDTLRSTTVEALEDFKARGGKIIFAGKAAQYVDAAPSHRVFELADQCDRILWSKSRILEALEPYRMLSAFYEDGRRSNNLIYQLRKDTDCSWLFLCNVNNPHEWYSTQSERYTLMLQGSYTAQLYDTLTGEVSDFAVVQNNAFTTFSWDSYAYDSLLLRLCEKESAALPASEEKPSLCYIGEVAPLVPVTLSEPNVLVLDMPEYKLDDGAWNGCEEVLRICDSCKQTLGMSNAISGGTQPWVLESPEEACNTLSLRFTVKSEIALPEVKLGIEDLDCTEIIWNGKQLAANADGWYVDEAIATLLLGKLEAGENILELKKPFDVRTTVENCFILGDFGVSVQGRYAKITQPVRELAFGNWVHQGLPFYGGNVTYHCSVTGDGREQFVEACQFNQPVLTVALNGKKQGVICISPYRVSLGELTAGAHKLDITAFGNRINTFGEIHNSNYAEHWYGPHAWRSRDYKWTYEYRLWDSGILTAPRLLQAE